MDLGLFGLALQHESEREDLRRGRGRGEEKAGRKEVGHLLNKPKAGPSERVGLFVYPDSVEAEEHVLASILLASASVRPPRLLLLENSV